MNFENTRSNFSYIPDDEKLVSNTGELSKQIIENTPSSLVALDSTRVSNIIQASQYLTDKMTIFVSPTEKEAIQRVAISLEDYTASESELKDSIELFRSISIQDYYKFCYHSETDIVPFAPVEGIVSITTENYQSIISVNHYESTALENTAIPLSNTTQISFFTNSNDVHIKTLVKKLSRPDCEIILDHPKKEIKQENCSITTDLSDDIYNIYKSEDHLEYGVKWNVKQSNIYINGREVKKESDENNAFSLRAKIDNACGAVYDPNSKYHNNIVLSEETISNIPENLRKYTVREENISDEIIIPMNSSCSEIESYMNTQLNDYYIDVLQQNIMPNTTIVSDLFDLPTKFVRLLFCSLRSSWDYSKHGNAFRDATANQLKSKFQTLLGYKTDTDFSKLEILTNRCYIAPIEHPYKTRRSQMFRTYIGTILRCSKDIDGHVYMGVNVQTKKTKVLNQDSKEHLLVKVSDTDQYSLYEDEYGWIKQKDITEKTIDKFDISEELREKFESTDTKSTTYTKKKSSISERKLTVHKKTSSSKQTTKFEFKEYKKELQSSDKILILYPRSADKNLTDNRDILTEYVQMAAPSSNEEVEYLKESDSVYTHEEYIEKIDSMSFTTVNSERTFSDINSLKGIGYIPVYHVINDMEKQLLDTKDELKTLAKQHAKESDIDDDISSCQYIPLTISKYRLIEPFITKGEDVILASPDVDFNLFGYNKYKAKFSLFKPYIDLKLSENSQERAFFNSIEKTNQVVTDEFITVIEKLCD